MKMDSRTALSVSRSVWVFVLIFISLNLNALGHTICILPHILSKQPLTFSSLIFRVGSYSGEKTVNVVCGFTIWNAMEVIGGFESMLS